MKLLAEWPLFQVVMRQGRLRASLLGREISQMSLDLGSWSKFAHEEAPGAVGSGLSLGQVGTTRVSAVPATS
jgi:hypothetical protein